MPDIENPRTSVLWDCQEITDSHPNMSVWKRKKGTSVPFKANAFSHYEEVLCSVLHSTLLLKCTHLHMLPLTHWCLDITWKFYYFFCYFALRGGNAPARNYLIYCIHVSDKSSSTFIQRNSPCCKYSLEFLKHKQVISAWINLFWTHKASTRDYFNATCWFSWMLCSP